MLGLHERSLTYRCTYYLLVKQIKSEKGDKTKIRTQQYYYTTEYQSKRNPTAKPRWARPPTQHQALTLSSIDKSLRRSCHRVKGPKRGCVIKEESKAANRVWVDHQSCSMLHHINVITNHFIMRNYFSKLR